ncbi:hypothetical protein BCV69DRAFT_128638 [Microstroma glucosiphilum]|uniref:Uncharacterized protein n=1 Tax=Pseudomicrostroma glucosiphilum TaxID=1684307 RepID=A0A316TVW8_9BASI|nr:hypothetical protein BCV69DRAFT_128638 [Pseudomicrostroma glucosiphilum]PWN17682.1 hypothetical protein BCV69DRAFT_128638 [Pseudomicrostroma glucosiphilum]
MVRARHLPQRQPIRVATLQLRRRRLAPSSVWDSLWTTCSLRVNPSVGELEFLSCVCSCCGPTALVLQCCRPRRGTDERFQLGLRPDGYGPLSDRAYKLCYAGIQKFLPVLCLFDLGIQSCGDCRGLARSDVQ